MPRLSGLQKEVLSLYRELLRAVKTKPLVREKGVGCGGTCSLLRQTNETDS